MKVSLENKDKVNGLLSVTVEKEDYQEKVEKILKDFRRDAQIPGFRKGKVPMGLIKKQHGIAVLVEEVNKLLSDGIYNYIKENDIRIIGNPLPNEEKQAELNFETMEEFEFIFDIAIAPEINADVSKEDKVDYYTVEISDEMINNQVNSYRSYTGEHQTVESYEDKDMLKGHMAELDEEGNIKEGGITVEETVMMPSAIKEEEQKLIFENAKVNDVLTFNPYKAFDGNKAELSSLLKLENNEDIENLKADFSFQISEIRRFVEGEINQELFDKVLGEGVVSTEEEFKEKIKEQLAYRYGLESEYKLQKDLHQLLLDKAGKIEFPDELLKRMFKQEQKEELTEEDYKKAIEDLTLHLIEEELVKKYEIKIEEKDIQEMAKSVARLQMMEYGALSMPDEIIDNFAQNMLKDEKTANMLITRAINEKLTAALKENVTLNEKKVSTEEFQELLTK
ncbi:MAG: trigger factor [Bacteroidales bacterium]|nr:trigger factor [Bacteroidales bacterium]